MSVQSVKKTGTTAHKPVKTQPKKNNQKTMKLIYFYDRNGKQLGQGDYYTSNYGAGNMYSYESILRMNDKQLAKLQIRKEVKEFSYTPEPPAPKEDKKSWFDKFVDFICA
ncbi:hypothetical protein J6E39_06295 [bacterium]|nr:hypothetical protein [bacterium]